MQPAKYPEQAFEASAGSGEAAEHAMPREELQPARAGAAAEHAMPRNPRILRQRISEISKLTAGVARMRALPQEAQEASNRSGSNVQCAGNKYLQSSQRTQPRSCGVFGSSAIYQRCG